MGPLPSLVNLKVVEGEATESDACNKEAFTQKKLG